ncbi:protein NO VEIN domain-containing protein [Deinococcus arcticus]|nr:DUF3883 domain-containing protein [Deinococcus arcticus]
MEPQIFNQNELNSRFALRVNQDQDRLALARLLQDDELTVSEPFSPHGLHEYRGQVTVRGEAVDLKFHHKGQSRGGGLSALRSGPSTSPEIVRLLRQIIVRNAKSADLGITASRPPFDRQPSRLGIRVGAGRTSGGASGKGKPYQLTVGYLGEQHFVNFLAQEASELEVEWLNQEREQGLPYDVRVGGRLAVDVKATQTERDHVLLTPAERLFRETWGLHHAIALVTLRTDPTAPPAAVDLYTGPSLTRTTLAQLRFLLAGLPPVPGGFESAVAPSSEATGEPFNSSPVDLFQLYPLFKPGTYRSGEGQDILSFSSDGSWSRKSPSVNRSGRYAMVGRQIHLQDHTFLQGAAEERLFAGRTHTHWVLTDVHGAAYYSDEVGNVSID